VARNVEIKARVADLAPLRDRVRSLASAPSRVLHQTDTFFTAVRGRLKLREFFGGSGELIFYERPDRQGPKLSSYLIIPCSDPASLSELLGRALGVRGVVEKKRELFMVGRTRVHLDEVQGLGSYLELEVVLAEGESEAEGQAEARELLARLGIASSQLVREAYVDLLERSA
jgi:predicted adenylyl cyclase CyaB